MLKRPCSTPRCPEYQPCTKHGRGKTLNTKAEQDFYNSSLWRRTSKSHRQEEPLCRAHMANGFVVGADVTDHIHALRDGGHPFDESNLQSLCHPCHNKKRRQEQTARYQ